MQTDKELGQEIHALLLKRGIETPTQRAWLTTANQEACVRDSVRNILVDLGLDLDDDSLRDTPKRVAKMYCSEIFSGLNYANFPKCTTIQNRMGYDEIILVKDITLRSCCEHHLQAIYGRAHIAYIPNQKVLGLSKFARIADFFASRPQVQERLTEQISCALGYILGTDDIAVIIEADHFCMRMRGVEDPCSSTTTSKMSGRFRTSGDARLELLTLIKGGNR